MKLMVRSMKEEFCLMRISHYGVRTLYSFIKRHGLPLMDFGIDTRATILDTIFLE